MIHVCPPSTSIDTIPRSEQRGQGRRRTNTERDARARKQRKVPNETEGRIRMKISIHPKAVERSSRRMRGEPSTRMNPCTASSTASTSFRAVELVRPHMKKLAAYTPIEPFEILSRKLGRDPDDICKLDANENPYGPPPEVLQALGSLRFPNIYPDPECRALREALAKDVGIPMEHLLVGCGADELIDLVMRVMLDSGDRIVDTPPTFTMYAFDADVNNAEVITVPRTDSFRVDIEGIKKAVDERQPKIVFLTSPNNPDGSVISDEELLQVLELPVLVVLDEAYIEFGTSKSRMDWVTRWSNLAVLRTFSKRAGLAGLRVGYGAFPLDLIEYLWRAKQPYNVSVAAEVAACAALSNPEYLAQVRDALVAERLRLHQVLSSFPFLAPYPSEANFILCKVKGRDAGELKAQLAQEGVMVRHYAKKELAGYIRVSVGKPEQTDILERALQRLA